MNKFEQITPPERLLMGPGPINIDPRILHTMSNKLIGQYDPMMTNYMNEVMQLYRIIFNTKNLNTLLIDGTSRAGIEAIFISMIKPGDKVLIPIFGRFGQLLYEISKRCKANVHTIEVPWGEIFKPDQIEYSIKKIKPKFLLTVHGDTSTTMLQPLEEIGLICQKYKVIFYTDATASCGGNYLNTDDWKIDAVSAGMQKCLGGPSGTSPITINDKTIEIMQQRQRVEFGKNIDDKKIIFSNYFDINMIIDYWSEKRLNHHTEATTALYAAHECARLIIKEGIHNRILRHKLHGDALLYGIKNMGLKIFGNIKYKMNNILGIIIPKKINGEQVRKLMLEDFGIEIGTSFGPLKGKIWRIGTMGYNSRKDCVLRTLSALESILNKLGFKTIQGKALQATWDFYNINV
ncbi:alanine--glyoxylate aminotransferase family protein [Candidatus Purcelliella pentastirinorum]|uniref:Alanine--glyoxylate aminotransferase family protein n=1 Tax=Candidatus Purcelliella pentastirinorum TaxID=472834 RepID=A0AAX3N8W2_9ENTR|nr:alanine--glyoxylate aminotransferase family protein [Candidatus Purcelliella pentastirinorum]WDI78375.1 alanine--glyoxylate aminotransferase family protein [Candidatus Purcelliella pentastirinorum]WDR80598.1 alanine--glyoxylate aminotransferase family protein [Candidatus Purcelliella pentastirinorum]